MLEHVLREWGALDPKVKREHAVFARDGWLCVVPGCTSMRNLHDHHIRFRSQGGGNGLVNRIAVCAWHHLRGIHNRLIRVWGEAPAEVYWQLGPVIFKGDVYQKRFDS